jgi:hypothetical protein
MCAPTMRTIDTSSLIGGTDVFMTGSGYPHAFQSTEIDQFLLAMMEAGWRRGLRPARFDPSAGELMAVQRHLNDMRTIALARGETPPDPAVSDIGGDGKKDW